MDFMKSRFYGANYKVIPWIAGLLIVSLPMILFYLQSVISQFISSRISPVYYYYLNGLSYTLGRRIHYIDDPGTPVQAYIGELISYMSEAWCTGGLCHPIDYAFVESEKILFIATIPVILLMTFFLIASFRFVQKISDDHKMAGLFYVLTWFAVPGYIYYLTGLRPELFMLTIGTICAYLVCRDVYSYGLLEKIINPFILGSMIGLGLAIKFIFAPFIFLFILMKGFSRKIIFLVCIPISFVFFTRPIQSQYSSLFNWLGPLISGEGQIDFWSWLLPDQPLLFKNFFTLITTHFSLTALVLLSVGILISSYSFRHVFRDRKTRMVFVFIGITVLQFIVALKRANINYFLPAMSLLPWMIVFSVNKIKPKVFDRVYIRVFAILIPFSTYSLVSRLLPEIRESREILAVEALAQKNGCYLYELNGSGIGSAFALGNIWSSYQYNVNIASHFRQRMISGIYSGSVTNPGNTYTFKERDYQKILDEGCFIIISKSWRDAIFGLDARPVFQGKEISAFTLKSSNLSSYDDHKIDNRKL